VATLLPELLLGLVLLDDAMPRQRFDPAALQPFIEEALAAEADPLSTLSFEQDPAPPERKPTFRKIGLPALLGGAAADIWTTDRALASGRAREGNPIFGDMGRGGIAMTNAAINAALALLLDRLAKRSPTLDKVATIGGLVGGGAKGVAAIHNMRVGR